jgi:hypothetical protein
MNSSGVLPGEKRIMAGCLCAHREFHGASTGLVALTMSIIRFKVSLSDTCLLLRKD